MTRRPTIRTALKRARSAIGTPHKTVQICMKLLGRPKGDLTPLEFGEAHATLGFAERMLGRIADAERDLTIAFEQGTATGDKALIADSALQLGLLFIEEYRFADSIHNLELAAKTFAELGMTLKSAQALFALGNARWESGDREGGSEALRSALFEFTVANSNAGVVAVQCGLANMSMDEGHYDDALERLKLCLKILPGSTHEKNRLTIDLHLARCYSKLGAADNAIQRLKSVIRRSAEGGYHMLQAHALYHMSKDLAAQGNASEAERCIAEARLLASTNGFEAAFEGYIQKHA